MSDTPATWTWSTIGEVTQYIQRGKSPKYAVQSALPIINQKCIRWDELQLQHLKYIHPDQFEAWDEPRYIKPGDILWNSTGTGTVGRAYLVEEKDCTPPKVVDSHVTIVRASAGLEPRYLFAWIKSPAVQDKIVEMCDGTTNQIELSRTAIAATQIPVAPTEEQTRIANQLDTLLARINTCQRRLDNIPALLKRFRQAVLEAATTGALTQDWREHNSAPEWTLVALSDIAEVVGGVTKDSKKQSVTDEEVPYLRVANVQRGFLDLSEIKTIRVPAAKLDKLLLEPGDVLFNEGGDLDKLGRGWVWDGQLDRCTFQNHVFRARLKDPSNQPKFISWWGNSRGLDYFIRSGKQTTNLASINKRTLEALPISLPSPEEQKEIVRRVDALLGLAARIEARFESTRTHAQRLGPQVLAKAFRGELMPQDPSDEPASVLLAKLKTGRASAETTPARKRPKATPEQPKMSNVDQNYMKTVILRLGTDRFSFDELRAHAAGDYESLKTALFALLEEPNPVVRQVFDEVAKEMRLVRVKP